MLNQFSLHLTLEEAEDLLERAGYSLSNSDKRDIVMGWTSQINRMRKPQ